MTELTEQQLAKLPKWVQEHIKDITREREVAVRQLREFCDKDTPSPFYHEELQCTGEKDKGPSFYRHYIQAYKITVECGGVKLDVVADDKKISLQWDTPNRAVNQVALIPVSFQKAELVTKENMR